MDDPDAIDIARDVAYERMRRVLTGRGWVDGGEHPDLHQGLRVLRVAGVGAMTSDGDEAVDLPIAVDDVVDDIPWTDASAAVAAWRSVTGVWSFLIISRSAVLLMTDVHDSMT